MKKIVSLIILFCFGFIFFGPAMYGQAVEDNTRQKEVSELISHAVSLITLSPDSALAELLKAEIFAQRYNLNQEIPRIYNDMMRVFISQAKLEDAILYGRKGYQSSKQNSPKNIPFSTRSLGETFYKLGQLDSALLYVKIGEEYCIQNLENTTIHLYNVLIMKDIYHRLDDIQNVKECILKSKSIIESSTEISKTDKIVALNDILVEHLALGDTIGFSKDLTAYLKLIEPFKDGMELPEYHVEMFRFTNGSTEEWLDQLKGTLVVHRKLKRWDNLILSHYLLAQTLYTQSGMLDVVLQHLDSCIILSKRHKITHARSSALSFKKIILAQSGDYESAYRVSNDWFEFRNSMNMLEMKKNVNELNIRYESEKKENQILAQRIDLQKKKRQQNILIFGIGIVGVLAFAFESKRRSKRKLDKIENLQLLAEKDKNILSSHMQMMKTQMNPHFLFNSLNSIKHFILHKTKEDSAQYISDFSKLMRLNLQNSSELLISLDREMTFLKQYVHMEQMRFKDPFEVNWNIDEQIDLNNYLFPPMLIQPYIENAIWHGLRYLNKTSTSHDTSKTAIGKIDIFMSITNAENLICVIQDNGVGREKAQQIKGGSLSFKKSMGTQITEDRIAMTNTVLNANIRVATEDLYHVNGKAAGTRVTIHIPLIE